MAKQLMVNIGHGDCCMILTPEQLEQMKKDCEAAGHPLKYEVRELSKYEHVEVQTESRR